jgi:hypothetical protein
MLPEEIAALEALVRDYVSAHEQRMEAPAQGPRQLWASRPIRSEYHAVLDCVRDLPGTIGKYSDKTIEEIVDDLLKSALAEPCRLPIFVAETVAMVDHELLTRLYIPIEGVALDAGEHHLGDIRLVHMDAEQYEALVVRPFAETIESNPFYGPERAPEMVEWHRERMKSLRDRVCAEIPNRQDIELTLKLANDRAIDEICDFLQFAASIAFAHQKQLKITWASDAPRPVFQHAFAVSDDPQRHFNDHNHRIDVLHPLIIGEHMLKKFAESGLDRLASLTGRESMSEYERLLLRAVRWFAKGERESHFDDRKLSYVTAVDLFFSRPGKGVTRRLCEGFAFGVRDDNDFVPAMAEYMYDVFGSRSETSHAGELGIEDEKSIDSLRFYVRNFIIAMTRQQFSTKADVAAWVSSRKASMTPIQRDALKHATSRS